MSEKDLVIGQNLAKLRGERTQQDIAEAMRAAGYKWSQATVWSVEKGERPIRLLEAATLAGILKSSIDRMLLADQDAELVDRLWKFEHDLAIAEQDLANAVRDYEDRKWALHFVMEDMQERLPNLGGSMQPKVQLKLSSAKRLLQETAESIVSGAVSRYRSQDEEGEQVGEHTEEA
ncbi:helix-turn-helix domain-containing protein [Arthrobacter sp. Leaf137]|uniref:helix-turn-helix domain-containing protein n=1 Tax=Arthrobacter sp. Leaf137 TaxID=1736271 RepID=UPI0012E2580F|nr:hypothetical protein [Arthrobacter sp. Leaf137]